MGKIFLLISCFLIFSESHGQNLSSSEEAPWVSVEIRGREIFQSTKVECRIRRSPTAIELYYFFRTLGAFELRKGLINISRKANGDAETVIAFAVCKLVSDGKGDTTIALEDGDVLEAYESEF